MYPILNAFTVDVEDFYQVAAYEKLVQYEDWATYGDRVVDSTHKLLDLLMENQVHGTFFIVGWTAKKYPELVKKINDAGHEIGIHSFRHRLIYNLTPEEFRKDTRESIDTVESIIGRKVVCFRAPSFSITQKSLWALDILAELGIKYDSSIFPIYHDRYGIPDCNPEIHEIVTSYGTIHEFPPAVYRMAGVNFPVSGGGYFRLYPLNMSIYLLRKINRDLHRPFVFYVHPWEVDPDQPRINGLSLTSRFRHHVGIGRELNKLQRLLWNFRFGKVSDVVNERQSDEKNEKRVC